MDARTLLHGLSPARIADIARVSVHTARRWKRRGRVPPRSQHFLELVIAGELGAIARAWCGWSVRDGKLISPEGLQVTPGEIRAIPVRMQLVRALERELERPIQRNLRF